MRADDLAEGLPTDPLDSVEAAIGRAAEALTKAQREDGHWVFELEADATIPSEYILLRHYLGEPDDLELEAAIGRYLRRIQGGHGGWPLYQDGAFDISATVKAYYALKMIGDDIDAPHMARARAEILKRGGAGASNVFTRIQLALFGAGKWSVIPEMPVELMLAPKNFPINLYRMSYWARTVIVPLLVLAAKRPVARNPRGVKVDELYAPGRHILKRALPGKWVWETGFGALDIVLKRGRRFWPKKLRQRAIQACVDFVVERLNGEDGLGAIYPAMANSVMMFDALGYAPDHPHRAIARTSVEKLLVRREDGEVYCQPCVSPVWDTALAAHAMLEAGGDVAEASAVRGLDWLKPRQILDVKGDWQETRPDVRPGGWAFQYGNDHYPDLDDTAVVVMAMDRARPALGDRYDEAIDRGVEWNVGLQSHDGGYAAFDADNTHFYLNDIPFADHGALLDPPTADVTARVVSMLAQVGEPLDSPRMVAALDWLKRDQHPEGSWWGRWGVNYIYGTWSVLCALNAAGIDPANQMMRRAARWLIQIQNADGGWGESCDSYDLARKGHEPAPSNASQTAWALLGLMAAGEVDHPAVVRGIAWLERHQAEDGLWGQEHYTGGGFPRVFYLRYHGYPKYFPLWALARYRNLKRGNTRRVAYGM
ncbi:squalene--hopene cyclase [Sphingomonas oligoaromativorans]|uniref:squalene--hopene cyclase n=1 Tax=Sphingomonas oligoaromativorans TaxID=575322 RepID=UPI001ABB523C|nr:squalene--hopene cyclase [Sphingomonas oligoaromativorans]NIJ33129.1 squalene-hopene/tetraprenyl-beta-curcumene cyclase [Sphingomonas oligoaromativorans]